MVSKRKFYRQVFTVEVLSEDQPLKDMDLEGIAFEITDGDCSGSVEETECEKVAADKMALLLIRQGSDPGFFMIDEKGNDVSV